MPCLIQLFFEKFQRETRNYVLNIMYSKAKKLDNVNHKYVDSKNMKTT